MKIQHAVEIARPPEAVWPWLDDPERQKLWMKGLLSNEVVHETPEGVGTTFRMKIQEGRRATEYDGEVTAYDEPRHLRVRITGGCFRGQSAMEVDYRLEPTARGTRLDYVCEARMTGASAFFFGWVFRLFGKMQIKALFRRLEELAEASARVPAA